MKRALALAGGGSKGSFQIGVWKALKELGISFDIVTGTSIGAVNGALMVQGDFETAYDLWNQITVKNVMNNGLNLTFDIEYYIEQREEMLPFLKSYVEGRGADITPFKEILNKYLDEERFFKSPIDFGIMTVQFPNMLPREIKKNMIKPGYLKKWVLASATCFPAFPLCKIDEENYIDGGYYDNLPIDTAFRLGAQEVIAVALKQLSPQKKYANNPLVRYIEPSHSLGLFLSFEKEEISKNIMLGYIDTMKAFKRLNGKNYTFYLSDNSKYEASLRNLLAQMFHNELENKLKYINLITRFESSIPTLESIIMPRLFSFKSLDEYFIFLIEAYMKLFEYDFYKIYNLEEVLNEFIDHFKPNVYNEKISTISETVELLSKEEVGIELLRDRNSDIISCAILAMVLYRN